MNDQITRDETEAAIALKDGIGDGSIGYKIKPLVGGTVTHGAVIAYRDAVDAVYALIDNTRREHQPESKAVFMLELAVEITKLLRTMVIPVDSPTPSLTFWGGKNRGPFVAYRFKVVEPGEVAPSVWTEI